MDERFQDTWRLIRRLEDPDFHAYIERTREELRKQLGRDIMFGGLNPYAFEQPVRQLLQKHGIYDFGEAA